MLALIMPTSWIATAILSLALERRSAILSIIVQTGAYFLSAFLTRLVIEHHQSRYQIFYFTAGAAILEIARPLIGTGRFFSWPVWSGEVLGAIVGIMVAREIAHHGYFGL